MTQPLWQTRKFRIAVLFGVIALLALILILQNFDTTEVQFFFWKAEAPLAGVIFTAMLVGAGLQALIRLLWKRRKAARQAEIDTLRETARRLESEDKPND